MIENDMSGVWRRGVSSSDVSDMVDTLGQYERRIP